MEDDHVIRNETSERASALPWHQWFQAFGNLLETLNRARSLPASERGRYVSELTAMATFISTFDKQLGHRFFDFASRLGDLDKGRNDDPLFHPAKIWDRHLEASRRWRAKARAVLAIEALIATGPGQGRPRASSLIDFRNSAGLRALRRQRHRWPSC